jgi:hypothetical protein
MATGHLARARWPAAHAGLASASFGMVGQGGVDRIRAWVGQGAVGATVRRRHMRKVASATLFGVAITA